MKNNVPGKWVVRFIHFMKISTWVLAILWCLSVTFIAEDVNGQEVLKKRLSISFNNERLSKALEEIAKATGVNFTYNGLVANSKIKVSASVYNQELSELLHKILLYTPYSYEVLDEEIFIYNDKKKSVSKPLPRIITGVILDDKGQLLHGVTVKVKGTENGTITAINGDYRIKINDDADIITFSFIGFKTTEKLVGTNKILNIKLEPNAQSVLDEVAVVAYGTQRKISLIGAQSTAEPDDLKQPVADFTTLLTGRVSGIIGVQRSGQPGKDGSNVYIRGLSGFVSSSNINPLTLVDGVERGIDMLNINDVQSITILKDASATAVYGVRGANGVILVQTKRGKAGKAKVSGDYYEGLSQFTKTPVMADGITYMRAVNEALTTRGQSAKYTDTYIARTTNKTDPLLYPDVNWLEAIFNKTSSNRKASVNISGGPVAAVYYLSVSYLNQKGLLKTGSGEQYDAGIDYGRYNFLGNVDLQVFKSTKINFGLNGYVSNGNYPSQTPAAIFSYALTVPPTEFPTEYPGGLVPGKTANGSEPNPFGQLIHTGYSHEYNSQLNSQIRLTQNLDTIAKGLNFSAMFAYDRGSSNSINRYKNPDTWQPDHQKPYNDDGTLNLVKTSSGTGNFLSFDSVNSGYYNNYTESSFNYGNLFDKHRIGGLLLFYNRSSSSYPASNYSTYIPHRERGLAGRATYAYNDKYFAEFNIGYNGSSNFAPGKRYGAFPAFGIGWLASEEPFFVPLKKVVSMFKLRYADGYVGSDDTAGPNFAYLTILREGAAGYSFGLDRNSLTGISIDTYGVTTTWSTSRKQNLGVDVSLFNKIGITADVFKERRSKVIMQRSSIPLFEGLTTNPFANLGVAANKGFDVTLTGQFNVGKLALSVHGAASYNKAKIVDNDDPIPRYPWMDKRGHSPIAIFGYVAQGLFTSQEEIDKSAVPGDKTIIKPGDIKYKDLNNDGLINNYDMTAITEGNLPAFTYGAGFTSSYKGFFFNAYFVGNANAKQNISGTGIQPFSTNGGISNAYANITDRWTVNSPRQDAFYPRLAYGNASNANNTAVSSWWVKDMSFIRLKTLDLGYNLPTVFLTRFGIKNTAVYLQGYNLATFSKFKLWDPEAGSNNGTQYPNVKTLVLGLRMQLN